MTLPICSFLLFYMLHLALGCEACTREAYAVYLSPSLGKKHINNPSIAFTVPVCGMESSHLTSY